MGKSISKTGISSISSISKSMGSIRISSISGVGVSKTTVSISSIKECWVSLSVSLWLGNSHGSKTRDSQEFVHDF